MVSSSHPQLSWMSDASRHDFDAALKGGGSSSSSAQPSTIKTIPDDDSRDLPSSHSLSSSSSSFSDADMGFVERAFSAAGAAVLSAVLVNPLDVAKTRLQAQAAGVPYASPHHRVGGRMAFAGPSSYKGTMDVFYKIIRQEGISRLWRGTNAGLALAVPTVGIYLPFYDIFRNWIEDFTERNAPKLTPYAPLVAGSIARSLACIACSPIELARTRMQAFKEIHSGTKPPGMWKTLLGVLSPVQRTANLQNLQGYRVLWTGVGAQLARDVPFSAICWSTLEPIRRKLLNLVGEEGNAASILGANFSAGFVAGSFAAAATCPLDVAKTRRQIEKDPAKALRMTTRQTLIEVWRDGRMKGLFMGVGPRVARAGPSVGIVVSFYEVVKFALHKDS
ncbi:mitochondrial carrier protein MTM1 isoform X3 [Amborella trichopoda]|uniref:mitochondrial carrier protein MTM1 isoform X3 n=1 Tax=Amborella trichopoda TaxID=13333 RepID=UPI0009C1474F|nr:mitochondrial carrier protein MTM1 isoform X3 [Amborella trichopoda]|eukprot:XP_020518391.1 mitochondrial carrier protein MTM1 isoform X3 [Amborella trichopoda]